jgi:hypothetical protein
MNKDKGGGNPSPRQRGRKDGDGPGVQWRNEAEMVCRTAEAKGQSKGQKRYQRN